MENVTESLNKVVKDIKIVAKTSKKGGKNHFVKVELINGKACDVWCDREVADLIQTCNEMGVEPIRSFTLEKRVSEKNGKEYIAVILTVFNGDEYFYFLPRAFDTIIELLYAKENAAASGTTAADNKKAKKE